MRCAAVRKKPSVFRRTFLSCRMPKWVHCLVVVFCLFFLPNFWLLFLALTQRTVFCLAHYRHASIRMRQHAVDYLVSPVCFCRDPVDAFPSLLCLRYNMSPFRLGVFPFYKIIIFSSFFPSFREPMEREPPRNRAMDIVGANRSSKLVGESSRWTLLLPFLWEINDAKNYAPRRCDTVEKPLYHFSEQISFVTKCSGFFFVWGVLFGLVMFFLAVFAGNELVVVGRQPLRSSRWRSGDAPAVATSRVVGVVAVAPPVALGVHRWRSRGRLDALPLPAAIIATWTGTVDGAASVKAVLRPSLAVVIGESAAVSETSVGGRRAPFVADHRALFVGGAVPGIAMIGGIGMTAGGTVAEEVVDTGGDRRRRIVEVAGEFCGW